MRVELGRYRCDADGTEFEAVVDVRERLAVLLRSEGGSLAFADVDDLSLLLDLQGAGEQVLGRPPSDLVASRRARRLLAVAADADDDGSPYLADAGPLCPGCGSGAATLLHTFDPPRTDDVPLVHLTFTKWSRLSADDKRAAVASASADLDWSGAADDA